MSNEPYIEQLTFEQVNVDPLKMPESQWIGGFTSMTFEELNEKIHEFLSATANDSDGVTGTGQQFPGPYLVYAAPFPKIQTTPVCPYPYYPYDTSYLQGEVNRLSEEVKRLSKRNDTLLELLTELVKRIK